MYHADWKKYLIVFLITLAIFATAFYTSGRLNRAKLEELRAIQDGISIDLLSSEMQFSLLASASCDDAENLALSTELDNLGSKLSYAEESIDADDREILRLKKNYSLFEMRDYLLGKQLAEKCKKKPLAILYFYSNRGFCEECKKQGIALTELRRVHPAVRVYSFDYDLDLSALQTLIEIHKVDGEKLPALIINRHAYYGYQSIENITQLLPELTAATTATSSKPTRQTSHQTPE